MILKELFSDKDTKPKEKIETLSQWILEHPQSLVEIIDFAEQSKDPVKGSCIEAMEFATKLKPEIATIEVLRFVTVSLTEKAPRIRWESAKVIGNIAHLFPGELDDAIVNLLTNTEHEGTVVRWSAAFAFGEILKLKGTRNEELIPAVEAIVAREEKESIRKIYRKALKVV